MGKIKETEGIQRDTENPPQELRSQEFSPLLTQNIPEVRKKTSKPALNTSDHQGMKIDPSLSNGGVKSGLTRGQKIMQGKLAKGYRDKHQAQRSKIILDKFLFKESEQKGDHSVTAKDSPESSPPNNSEEATSEGHLNDSTGAKA